MGESTETVSEAGSDAVCLPPLVFQYSALAFAVVAVLFMYFTLRRMSILAEATHWLWLHAKGEIDINRELKDPRKYERKRL